MKVLTKNVQLMFTCKNENCPDGPSTDRYESDPVELCKSRIPICPVCGYNLSIDQECFIKN